jgi:uncharacterized membrane protein YidH (DUF202 family)
VYHRTLQINHQPDATIFQFIILTFFTAEHVSGVLPPIIRSSMAAVAVAVGAATAVTAPDDWRQNARNMFSCKKTSG